MRRTCQKQVGEVGGSHQASLAGKAFADVGETAEEGITGTDGAW